jgi:hypothetical protein
LPRNPPNKVSCLCILFFSRFWYPWGPRKTCKWDGGIMTTMSWANVGEVDGAGNGWVLILKTGPPMTGHGGRQYCMQGRQQGLVPWLLVPTPSERYFVEALTLLLCHPWVRTKYPLLVLICKAISTPVL